MYVLIVVQYTIDISLSITIKILKAKTMGVGVF